MGNDSVAKKGAYIFLFVFIVNIFVGYLIKMIHSFFGAGIPSQMLFIIGTQIFAILIPVLLFARALQLDTDFKIQKILKLKVIGKKDIVLCAIIGCAVQAVTIVVNAPVTFLLNSIFGGLPPQLVDPPETVPVFLLSMIVIAILPAVCEELLFRGIILSTQKSAGFGAVLISAVYFGVMHNDIRIFISVFILGMVLGTVTLSTGSVFAAMIVHFFNNAFGFALQFMAANHYIFVDEDRFYYWMALICVPILILGLRSFPINKLVKQINIKQAFLNVPFLLILFFYFVTQAVTFSAIMK